MKAADKSNVERQLQRVEEENMMLQRQVADLQTQLGELEQQHAQRLIDLTTRNRKESEMEVERLRASQLQTEKQLESREKSHRQRVKGLEEQIATLRDQLGREIRTRQSYLNRSSSMVDEEMKGLHSVISESLHIVSRGGPMCNPCGGSDQALAASAAAAAAAASVDPLLMDMETRRLNESMGSYTHETQIVRTRSPNRRCLSPSRLKLHHRY